MIPWQLQTNCSTIISDETFWENTFFKNSYFTLPLINFPNPQQQGFQPKLGCRCITASFNLQEIFNLHVEHGSPVYATFLGTRKAFDTMWKNCLVVKLHQFIVTGYMWTLIDDCYTNTSGFLPWYELGLVTNLARCSTRGVLSTFISCVLMLYYRISKVSALMSES